MTVPGAGRRRFLFGAAAAAAGAGGGLLLWPAQPDSADVAAQADAIARRFGVRIGYGDPAGFFVQPYGPRDAASVDGRMTSAVPTDVAVALEGVAGSLAVYPPGFYARTCRAIFICGTLLFGAVAGGGTYGPAWIILAADPSVGPAGIRETARLGVHHEFSSLVFLRDPAIAPRWTALLPPDWTPVQQTDDALRKDGGAADEARGFLSAYGATSAENDFNTYAEVAFTAPERLLALAAGNLRIAWKTAALIDAYVRLDGRMAAVFRSLGLGGLAGMRAPERAVRMAPAAVPAPTVR